MVQTKNSEKKSRSISHALLQYVSLGFVFMMVSAAIVVVGFRCLEGVNVFDANSLAGLAPRDCWPVDFQNLSEVRWFLWRFSGLVGVSFALATYAINNTKYAAFIGGFFALYYAFSSAATTVNPEVLTAIFVCVSGGILCGWGLNRVTVSKSNQPWKRVFGRSFVILAAMTIVLIPNLESGVLCWLVMVPCYYLQSSLFSFGAMSSLYQKAKAESLALG